MVKYCILLCNMLGLLIYGAFFTPEVFVSQQLPSKINPGESFVLEMTLNKGSVKGFARMKQVLPEGFTATALDVKGGDFVFLPKDHAVKTTWTTVPADSIFTISYTVTSGSASGKFQLAGAFNYLVANARKIADIPPADLQVGEVPAEPIAATTSETQPEVATEPDRKSTRLNSSHIQKSRMPSSA